MTTEATAATVPTASAPAAPAVPAAPDAATIGQAATAEANATAAQNANRTAEGEPVPPPAETPKPDPTARDEVADALAQLNRQMRETAKIKETYQTKEKTMAERLALADRAEKVKTAIAEKRYLDAILAADESVNPDEAAVLLMEQAGARDAKPMTREEIERITAEKMKEAEDKATAAAEAKKAQDFESAKDLYGNSCKAEFSANATKYPLVGALGVKGPELIEWAIKQTEKNGSAPSPAETLKHFEDEREAALKSAGWSKAEIAAMKTDPTKPIPTAPTADTRGAAAEPPAKGKRETMAEYDARIKAQFRAGRGQPTAAK
jgi:hypothetical protein